MAREKARTREESEKMRKKEAQRTALLEATASANKKNVTSLDVTRVAVAQSSKYSAENNISTSKQVQPSNQRKLSEHSKVVQSKRRAQKRSRS